MDFSQLWYVDVRRAFQGGGVGKGPITAKGCGHDIPRDGPGIVASELAEMLLNLPKMEQSKI